MRLLEMVVQVGVVEPLHLFVEELVRRITVLLVLLLMLLLHVLLGKLANSVHRSLSSLITAV